MPERGVLLPLHEEVHYQWDELLHANRHLSANMFLGTLHVMSKLARFGGFELAETDVHP